MIYTSVENPKIKEIKKLNQKKYRDEKGKFLVEGEHLVLEAYKSGCLESLILEEGCSFSLDIEKIYVSKKIINFISELESPSSIIGVCHKKKEIDEYGKKVLILDGVQDPGNLGTIIRSSVAFDIDTIILSKTSVDVYNSKVLRASQGMIFYVNIVQKDLLTLLPKLKKKYYVYTTNVKDGIKLSKISKKDNIAIIVGNEGNGVSKQISDLADEYLCIDINKKCESLNVAVATSIILYELER